MCQSSPPRETSGCRTYDLDKKPTTNGKCFPEPCGEEKNLDYVGNYQSKSDEKANTLDKMIGDENLTSLMAQMGGGIKPQSPVKAVAVQVIIV